MFVPFCFIYLFMFIFIFIFEMNTHIQEKRNAVLTSNIKGHHKLYTHELVYIYMKRIK